MARHTQTSTIDGVHEQSTFKVEHHSFATVKSNTSPTSQTLMMHLAREQATFETEELTEIIYGGNEAVVIHNDAFKRVEAAMGSSDMSKLPRRFENTNHDQSFVDGLRTGKICMQESFKNMHPVFLYSTHTWGLGNASPFGIHTFLFLPFLKLQVSPEQADYWVPLANSGKILGSYCQTELGHGTFVGGIETTATFDEKTDEFVVHSPTISSTKFWPGALGYTCSHAIVMARLILRGKDLGIHPFMVQTRSLDDYKPMPGIELGDIGAKMAYNGTDNGYAIFSQVRIPRTNLLMRHATLTRDGIYTASPLREKLLYGGMLNGRFIIIRHSAFQLAQAVTIATRYSVVREQGRGAFKPSGPEQPVIFFQSQHYRLLTLISQAYANIFAWKECENVYQNMVELQDIGNFSTLPFVHTLACGLKAWSTQTAADGTEDARKMCGGHGYMLISGLPEIVASATAMATFEGENYVMWQQVASFLMKNLESGSLPPAMDYLLDYHVDENSCSTRGIEFLSHDVVLHIFQRRASRLVQKVFGLLSNSKLSKPVAWNTNMMALISAARATISTYVLTSFIIRVSAIPPSPIRDVLSRLVSIFALTSIVSPISTDAITFIEDGYLSSSQIDDIRSCVTSLLHELLPDAIALTDAWNFTDASLCSAIGCRDGNAYERLMAWVRQLPINVNAKKNGGIFKEGEKYLKAVIQAKL